MSQQMFTRLLENVGDHAEDSAPEIAIVAGKYFIKEHSRFDFFSRCTALPGCFHTNAFC
jgi:hypothetical protein